MKKKFEAKKLVHSTLPVVLSVSMLGTTALAEEAVSTQEDGFAEVIVSGEALNKEINNEVLRCGQFWFELNAGKSVTFTKYEGNDTIVTIPEAIFYQGKTYTVTKIGDAAFADNKTVTEVTLPDTLRVIGNKAFMGCTALEKIVVPQSVILVGDFAFADCYSLTEAELQNSSTGRYMFYDCNKLSKVTFSDQFTNLANSTFAYCDSLETITIPVGLTECGSACFASSGLKSIIYEAPTVFDSMFFDCENLEQVTFADTVTKIERMAFALCDIKEIQMGQNITEVGEGAF